MVNPNANHGDNSDHSQQHTMYDNKKHKSSVDTGATKIDFDAYHQDDVPDFYPSQGVLPTPYITMAPTADYKTFSFSKKKTNSPTSKPNYKHQVDKKAKLDLLKDDIPEPTILPSMNHLKDEFPEPTMLPSMNLFKDNVVEPTMLPSMNHLKDNILEPTMLPSMNHLKDEFPEPTMLPSMNHLKDNVLEPTMLPSINNVLSLSTIETHLPSRHPYNPIVTLGVICLGFVGIGFVSYKRYKHRYINYKPIPQDENKNEFEI